MVPPHKVFSVEDGKIPNKRLMSRFKTLHLAFGEAQLHFFSWVLPSTNASSMKKALAEQCEFLRDLKPENIFHNDSIEVKIGDFGLTTQNRFPFLYLKY